MKRNQKRKSAKVYPVDKFLSALGMVTKYKVLGRYVLGEAALAVILDKAYADGYVDAGIEQLESRIRDLEIQAKSLDVGCSFQMQQAYDPYANATPQGISRT